MLKSFYNLFDKFWDVIKYESLTADAKSNLFPRTCCSIHKNLHERELGLSKVALRCTEKLCLHSKIYCWYDNKSDKFKISSKWLNKRVLEVSGDRPMSQFRRVLEAINLTSTNIGFRTINHMVISYERKGNDLVFLSKETISRWRSSYKNIEIIRTDAM